MTGLLEQAGSHRPSRHPRTGAHLRNVALEEAPRNGVRLLPWVTPRNQAHYEPTGRRRMQLEFSKTVFGPKSQTIPSNTASTSTTSPREGRRASPKRFSGAPRIAEATWSGKAAGSSSGRTLTRPSDTRHRSVGTSKSTPRSAHRRPGLGVPLHPTADGPKQSAKSTAEPRKLPGGDLFSPVRVDDVQRSI